MTELEAVLLTIITASTPLLLAAIGELVVERSGVLNLGVEGMMVMGAVGGFAGAYTTGSAAVGIVAGLGAGVAMSLVFGFLTQTLVTNQVATGLALTLFGLGLSGLIGEAFTGLPGVKLGAIHVPGLSDLPFVGPVLFGQDALVYASIAITVLVAWVLARTRIGLVIRATGGNHHSAHALGYNVIAVRYACHRLRRRLRGARRRLPRAGLYAAMDRKYDGRTRLDCACAGGLRHLGAVPGRDWRVPVRHGVDHGSVRAGYRDRNSGPAPRRVALSGNNCRSGADLREPNPDEDEHARLHRPAFRTGPLKRIELQPR